MLVGRHHIAAAPHNRTHRRKPNLVRRSLFQGPRTTRHQRETTARSPSRTLVDTTTAISCTLIIDWVSFRFVWHVLVPFSSLRISAPYFRSRTIVTQIRGHTAGPSLFSLVCPCLRSVREVFNAETPYLALSSLDDSRRLRLSTHAIRYLNQSDYHVGNNTLPFVLPR